MSCDVRISPSINPRRPEETASPSGGRASEHDKGRDGYRSGFKGGDQSGRKAIRLAPRGSSARAPSVAGDRPSRCLLARGRCQSRILERGTYTPGRGVDVRPIGKLAGITRRLRESPDWAKPAVSDLSWREGVRFAVLAGRRR